MKTLFVTSEAYPFAKSGGLGDVSGALPTALKRRLVGCRVVLPLYENVPQALRDDMKFIASISVPVAWRRQYCGIYEAKYNGVTYYLLDNEYYFKRPGLYGYYDDAERFAFFSRAVLEIIPVIGFKPDVIHCNDWQTGLLPVYYHTIYSELPEYQNIKTIFTIHNIQYQGIYNINILEDVFGLSQEHRSLLEYDGNLNIMKGAIETANAVTTVSPTYAKEIMEPWCSYRLDSILKERSWKLRGIVNGVDEEVYNPQNDQRIYANYSLEDMLGKEVNKAALQKDLGLSQNPDVPMICIISRLVYNKGLDLIKERFDELMSNDLQFVILGSGDWAYESFFDEMAGKYVGKFSFTKGYNPGLEHKIYAGADILLMPSKTEPCGLSQMHALRYGTIPVVRQTGGLKDTILDYGNEEPGNGFTFYDFTSSELLSAINRALDVYSDKEEWNALVERAMKCDNSWKRSAGEYIKLYKEICQ